MRSLASARFDRTAMEPLIWAYAYGKRVEHVEHSGLDGICPPEHGELKARLVALLAKL